MNTVYYHYWIPDDWRSLFWYWQLDEQCRLLKESGLVDSSYINCFITMPEYWINDSRGMPFEATATREPILFRHKVEEYIKHRYPFLNVSFRDTGLENLYEGATLDEMHGDSLMLVNAEKETNLLYIHNKGICSAGPNARVWFDALNDTLITDWRNCVSALNHDNSNVVAVKDSTVRYDEKGLTHVSGNMFWTKSSYISKLERPIYNDRYAYERWVTSGDPKGEGINFVRDLKVDPFIEYPEL